MVGLGGLGLFCPGLVIDVIEVIVPCELMCISTGLTIEGNEGEPAGG